MSCASIGINKDGIPVITNDEIFQAMSECGPVSYIHRVDAVRHCTIVRFCSTDAVIQALKVKQIAGENVLVTNYTESRLKEHGFERSH